MFSFHPLFFLCRCGILSTSQTKAEGKDKKKDKDVKKDKKDQKHEQNVQKVKDKDAESAAAACAHAPKDAQPKQEQPKEKKPQTGDQKQKEGGKKGGEKKEEKKVDRCQNNPSNKIFVLPAEVPVGAVLTEFGRFPECHVVPLGTTVDAEFEKRTKEVRDTLVAMEAKEPRISELWDITKHMSLNEFKDIYAWLNARFDHDFYESDMTEESKKMVMEFLEKGHLVKDHGAVGADLRKHDLGFLVLLKSDGSSLYATKDLALAVKKFDQFHIDRSVYVVDAAQSMHFAQVFKTLELMGYEKAKKCYHLPYGMVVLKEGRMSSRHGTVIYFSQLREALYKKIFTDFLADKDWPAAEVDAAKRAISLAAIKYGMLNTDSAKDIVFEMDKWTAMQGNTGPYLMYAYTRISKILNDVHPKPGAQTDFSLLSHPVEREIMTLLMDYWHVVDQAANNYNSSPLCVYVFELAKLFSTWYEQVSVKNEPNAHAQLTRLHFIRAIADTVKQCLCLLGIEVLPRM